MIDDTLRSGWKDMGIVVIAFSLPLPSSSLLLSIPTPSSFLPFAPTPPQFHSSITRPFSTHSNPLDSFH